MSLVDRILKIIMYELLKLNLNLFLEKYFK